jgi:hypothetical protein
MRLRKIHNFQELLVNERVKTFSASYPSITDDRQIEDIACIALNALKPRYVRNLTDLQRYMTDDQRSTYEAEAGAAVRAAFEFVLFERAESLEHPASMAKQKQELSRRGGRSAPRRKPARQA